MLFTDNKGKILQMYSSDNYYNILSVLIMLSFSTSSQLQPNPQEVTMGDVKRREVIKEFDRSIGEDDPEVARFNVLQTASQQSSDTQFRSFIFESPILLKNFNLALGSVDRCNSL